MTIITSLVTTVKRERLHHSHIHSIFFPGINIILKEMQLLYIFPPEENLSKKMGVAIALT